MNAKEAIKMSEINLPSVIDRKYNSIIELVKSATKQGRTDIVFGYIPPCKEIIERLYKEGYSLYSVGDNFMLPRMYIISWKVEKPKKKWYNKLLGKF